MQIRQRNVEGTVGHAVVTRDRNEPVAAKRPSRRGPDRTSTVRSERNNRQV
jgi:hypothetical protein